MMSEAKQFPRLAVVGPTIATMGTRNKNNTINYPIGNVVPAILPMYSPKQFHRPGDVYRRPLSKSSSRQTPRPLGLIPERQNHTDYLPSRFSKTIFSQPSKFKQENDKNNKYSDTKPSTSVPATRLKPLNVQYRTKSALILGENIQSSTTNPSIIHEENDPDYMNILETLNMPPANSPEHTVDVHTYHDNVGYYQKQRHSVCLPIKCDKSKKPPAASRRRSHSLRVSQHALYHCVVI